MILLTIFCFCLQMAKPQPFAGATASNLNPCMTMKTASDELPPLRKRINWKDSAGMKFGRLTVIRPTMRRTGTSPYCLCRCECGVEKEISAGSLVSGQASCGCLRALNWGDLVGKRFRHFTIIGKAGKGVAQCLCNCGKRFLAKAYGIEKRGPHSCGCQTHDIISRATTKHGHTKGYARTLTYSSYRNMLRRCYGNEEIHHLYRECGITVCRRWREGEGSLSGFECFLKDMGERAKATQSLERVHNRKSYTPSNCVWAESQSVQANNTCRNIHITAFGKTLTPSQWSAITGLTASTIRQRMRVFGWSAEKALTQPV